jgi:hypothetical protein
MKSLRAGRTRVSETWWRQGRLRPIHRDLSGRLEIRYYNRLRKRITAPQSSIRRTLFSDDKPDRFFTVIKFWMDATPRALHLISRLAFLLIKSKTACRAEGLPEAGGRQDSFTDSPDN